MCFRDFDNFRLRVIMLNTMDLKGQTVDADNQPTTYMSAVQLQWLAESLDLSEKPDGAEWSILLLAHHPLDWGTNISACKILSAYNTGTAFSLTRDGVTVSYDYVGKNGARVIAQIHGHTHCFTAGELHIWSGDDASGTIGTKRITIPNACFLRNNEYGENGTNDNNGLEFGETTTYAKTADTAEDTAFCVVTIDLAEKTIYADHYGAGYDRVIGYQ